MFNTHTTTRKLRLICCSGTKPELTLLERLVDWDLKYIEWEHLFRSILKWFRRKNNLRGLRTTQRETAKQAILPDNKYCWFSHDVTKFQTSELLILLRFYFHDVLEQLKTNIQTNFHSEWVLGLVIDYTLEFLSFCVTWPLHDGRESCYVGLTGDLFRGIQLSEQFLY